METRARNFFMNPGAKHRQLAPRFFREPGRWPEGALPDAELRHTPFQSRPGGCLPPLARGGIGGPQGISANGGAIGILNIGERAP
jgi:hypothetical protein